MRLFGGYVSETLHVRGTMNGIFTKYDLDVGECSQCGIASSCELISHLWSHVTSDHGNRHSFGTGHSYLLLHLFIISCLFVCLFVVVKCCERLLFRGENRTLFRLS